MPEITQVLSDMGFTEIEAEAYVALLAESPVTAYRVAQRIGKPVANTYKAIESLERKGAVLVEDGGERRQCRAVPPAELLGRLQREFAGRCREAEQLLASVGSPSADDRVYRLGSTQQVIARARAMLERAEHVVLGEFTPALAPALHESLCECAARGVEVVVKAYAPVEMKGVRAVVRPRAEEITDALPGDTLRLSRDGREHLMAMLRREGDVPFHALWTASAAMSYLLYNGLINEISQVAVMRALDEDDAVEKVRAAFQCLRHLHPISSRGPVYEYLIEQLGMQAGAAGRARANGSSPARRG